MSGTESFDTDLATTAQNVVDNINAHTSTPNYKAYLEGTAQITISDDDEQMFDTEGYAVVASTTVITTTDVDFSAEFVIVDLSMLEASGGQWQQSWVREVIDWCHENISIDPNRFGVTGLSFGGETIYHMTAEGSYDSLNWDAPHNSGQDSRYRFSHAIPYAPRVVSGTTSKYFDILNLYACHGASDVLAGFTYAQHEALYDDQTENTLEWKFFGPSGIGHAGWDHMFRNNSTWAGYSKSAESTAGPFNIYHWVRNTPLTDRNLVNIEVDYTDYTLAINGTANIPLAAVLKVRPTMFLYDSGGTRLYAGQDVTTMLEFRETNDSGTLVDFQAIVTSDKEISVTPDSSMTDAQLYWLEATVYDKDGNSTVETITFTAGNNKRIYFNITRSAIYQAAPWNNPNALPGAATGFTTVSDAVWASITPATGDVQITSAGSNMPAMSANDIFYIEDHSAANNNGRYKVITVNTSTSDYDVEKQSGGTETVEVSESVRFCEINRLKTNEDATNGNLDDEDGTATGFFVNKGAAWGGTSSSIGSGHPRQGPTNVRRATILSYSQKNIKSSWHLELAASTTYEVVIIFGKQYQGPSYGDLSMNRVAEITINTRSTQRQVVAQLTTNSDGVGSIEFERNVDANNDPAMMGFIIYEV